MGEVFQILHDEIGLIGSNISALVFIGIVFAISFKISSFFENRVFRYVIITISLVSLAHPIHPQYKSVIFNAYNWIALGGLLPHLRFFIEDIEEKYYQLKYATINTYYFWLTVYYKLLRLIKSIIWLLVTIFNLLVWIYFTLKYTILLIYFAIFALYELVANKSSYEKRKQLSIFWQWYKDDWQYQSEQREQAKYEYRDWYKGKKFYYHDGESVKSRFESRFGDHSDAKHSKQEQDKKDSGSYSRKDDNKKEEKQHDYNKAYEDYKEQHGYSKQEESKSYQSHKGDRRDEKYESEHARFFSGNHYEVLGIGKDATMKEVSEAWKKLLKIYHPDLHPEDVQTYTQITQKINEAYLYFKKMKG